MVIRFGLQSPLLLWLDAFEIFRRIWSYLTFRFVDSPNLKVSTARLVIGMVLLVLVLVVSGKLTEVLDRRISKRTYLNAGLRYAILRLLKYVLVVVGIIA